METVNATLRIPKVLWDEREKVREMTGAKSVNSMMVALYTYTMMHGREHWLTNAIFQLPADQQAEAFEGVVAKFKSGVKERGNYFEAALERAVEAAGREVPKQAAITKMIDELRKIGRGEPETPPEDKKPRK